MIGEEESGILLCPRCDYAEDRNAGPPIPDALIRDPDVKP